jgi:thiol-disulfide isomerase/thioredoxin
LYAWWPERAGEDGTAIQVARSRDGGKAWARLGALHEDRTPTEHGFASMVAVDEGVRAFWLDGRNTSGGGSMALRTAIVGEFLGPSDLVDDRVCDCCGTDAALAGERPVVVYRDRSDAEVRDIAIAWPGPPGWQGAPVHRDDWEIAGCPVNGPQVVADADRVAVAWFTRAHGPELRLAWSDDGARTFDEPVAVAIADKAGEPLGRPGLALVDDREVVAIWLDTDGRKGLVRARRVARDGSAGKPLTLGETSADRRSGFPVVARSGQELVIAWTDDGMVARRLPLALLPPVDAPPLPGQAPEPARPPFPQAYAPDLLDGGTLSFSGLAGQPVLVNVWATWCAPCLQEIPELVRLNEAWSPRGLRVVGIAVDDELERVRRVVAEREIGWAVALDGSARVSATFRTGEVPTTLLYAPEGRLLWASVGPLRADDPGLVAAILASLATGLR